MNHALTSPSSSLPPSRLQVKASIKLRFVGANKKHAVVNRSFSLTQKPSKREYKAFEAALRTVGPDNVQSCLSYKCADLNKLVPEMMGVSTAVLESVVFVHQEDSCWPLAEDKVLKQKFDDIFAATEYTKALDAIKNYKNEKSKEIRALAAELETLETKLTTSNRLRAELDNANVSLAQLDQGISLAVQTVTDAKASFAPLIAKLKERDELERQLGTASQQHAHAQEKAKDCAASIENNFGGELEESDEQLVELDAKMSSSFVELTTRLDSLKANCEEIVREIERAEQVRFAWQCGNRRACSAGARAVRARAFSGAQRRAL